MTKQEATTISTRLLNQLGREWRILVCRDSDDASESDWVFSLTSDVERLSARSQSGRIHYIASVRRHGCGKTCLNPWAALRSALKVAETEIDEDRKHIAEMRKILESRGRR